jgi:hypothetical protein
MFFIPTFCMTSDTILILNKCTISVMYRGADKSLDRPTSLSIVFSVQGTGGSPAGPDPENRVGD